MRVQMRIQVRAGVRVRWQGRMRMRIQVRVQQRVTPRASMRMLLWLSGMGSMAAAAAAVAREVPDPQCNTTAWDAICPPVPTNWSVCFDCCQASQRIHRM